jgi:tRNA modification GTPase
MASTLFRPFGKSAAWPPNDPQPGQFWVGRLGDRADSPVADEVVFAVQSLVPVPRLEIHCHGGIEVVRWFVDIFASRGARVCTWQEFSRAGIYGKLRSQAAFALVEAPTIRTAAILLDQHHGAFDRSLAAIRMALSNNDCGEARRLIEALLRHGPVGRHLVEPWRVAIMGAPNVGKSSLVNAMAGYQRSVVAPTPGTTRDVVTTLIAVDGWPVELADTAGIRDQAAALEEQGIERARAAGRGADLCFWVLDASVPPIWPDSNLEKVRLIVNKVDLPGSWDLAQAVDAVPVSARTGVGVADLCRALARWLVPSPPEPGEPVPFTPTMVNRLEQANRFVEDGTLEQARRALDEIPADHPAVQA